jgi:hypothetical protein
MGGPAALLIKVRLPGFYDCTRILLIGVCEPRERERVRGGHVPPLGPAGGLGNTGLGDLDGQVGPALQPLQDLI